MERSKTTYPSSPPEAWTLEARDICAIYYHRLLDSILASFDYILATAPTTRDTNKQLIHLLDHFKTSRGMERTLFRPLLYIKQHTGFIRHSPQDMDDFSTVKAVNVLSDLVVYFLNLDKKYCAQEAYNFYKEYYRLASTHHLGISQFEDHTDDFCDYDYWEPNGFPSKGWSQSSASPPSKRWRDAPPGFPTPRYEGREWSGSDEEGTGGTEWTEGSRSPSPPPPTPPQSMTVDWYKKNGWREFIRDVIIIPQTGVTKDIEMCIENFRGTCNICRDIKTGRTVCLPSKVVVTWKEKYY